MKRFFHLNSSSTSINRINEAASSEVDDDGPESNKKSLRSYEANLTITPSTNNTTSSTVINIDIDDDDIDKIVDADLNFLQEPKNKTSKYWKDYLEYSNNKTRAKCKHCGGIVKIGNIV
jgi:hypothetical protein